MLWSVIWCQTDDLITRVQGPAGLAGLKGDPGKKGEKVRHLIHNHTLEIHMTISVCVCVWFRVMAVWLVWSGRRVSSERKVIEDCRETRDRREPKERRWTHKLIYTDIYTNSYRRWFNCVSADRVQLDLQDSMDHQDHRDCLWVSRHFNLQFSLGLFWCHSFCLYRCVSGIHGTKRI